MTRWKTRFLFEWILCFILFMAVGCSSKEQRKAKHLERARNYVETERLEEAVIEFKNAIQIDQRDDAAPCEVGEVLLKLKRFNEALHSFARSVSVNPGNLKAQLQMGQIFLAAKKTQEAKGKAQLVLDKSPEDLAALVLLAGVQIQEGDADPALQTLQKAVSIDPDHHETHLYLGRVFTLKGELDEAEKAYLKALTIDPQSQLGRLELAGIHEKKGQWDRAEAELKKMLQSPGSKHQGLKALGYFYERAGKFQSAEEIWKEAVNGAPANDVEPLLDLAAHYARRKSYPQALDALQRAASIKRDDPDMQLRVAKLQFAFSRFGEAEATLDKILEKDKGHVSANFLKGRMFLERSSFADATESFDLVITQGLEDPLVYYFRALSRLGKGEGKLAEKDLLRALELGPDLVEARFILTEFYLKDGDKYRASQQLDHLLASAPSDVRTLMLKGQLKILERDFHAAESAFKQVIELKRDHAPAYVQLGLVYHFAKRREMAIRSFEKALELNPKQADALAFLVGIHLQDKEYGKALELCKERKQKSDGEPSFLAWVKFLEGRTYLAEGDQERALEHFKSAIAIKPHIIEAYVALARINAAEGRLSEAISHCEAIVRADPGNVEGYMALGNLRDAQGDRVAAEGHYRMALEIKHDFGPAANNLAWDLAQGGGNIDEALAFAQLAKRQLPNNPAVMDTLGWIYYLKGSYLNAISELKDSLKQIPENPSVNYRLALAYQKNNQPDMAKKYVEKALHLDPKFEHADDARSLFQSLEGN